MVTKVAVVDAVAAEAEAGVVRSDLGARRVLSRHPCAPIGVSVP